MCYFFSFCHKHYTFFGLWLIVAHCFTFHGSHLTFILLIIKSCKITHVIALIPDYRRVPGLRLLSCGLRGGNSNENVKLVSVSVFIRPTLSKNMKTKNNNMISNTIVSHSHLLQTYISQEEFMLRSSTRTITFKGRNCLLHCG